MATQQNPPVPQVTEGLLKYLEAQFPDRCPSLGDSDRAIWVAVGGRKVVEHLKGLYDAQNNLNQPDPIGESFIHQQ